MEGGENFQGGEKILGLGRKNFLRRGRKNLAGGKKKMWGAAGENGKIRMKIFFVRRG